MVAISIIVFLICVLACRKLEYATSKLGSYACYFFSALGLVSLGTCLLGLLYWIWKVMP